MPTTRRQPTLRPAKKPTGLTLTQVTHIGRQAVKFGTIALVVLIVGRMFLSAFINFWKAVNPPPPPPPTVGFGQLPRLNFAKQTSDEKPKSYKLETATGDLPYFGDRAKVFLMPKSAISLLADAKAKKIAATYDFIFEPKVLDSRTYRWTKSQPLEMSLQMDIQTLDLVLKSDFLARPELLANKNLPESFEAVEQLKSFLSSADLLPADVATYPGQVSFLKTLGGELTEAASLSDADFLEVNLDRNPIDGEISMFGPEGETGSIHAILTGALSGKNRIVQLDYHYHPVDYLQVETYPLRDSRSAWKILQGGEGFIVNKGTASEAVIREVSLGYYDDWAEQDFLQPIYVFQGDGGFMGYVSALDPKYIQK